MLSYGVYLFFISAVLCFTNEHRRIDVGPVKGIYLSFPDEKGPILHFQRGHLNRVEYIKAQIDRTHLDTGSETTDKTRDYARSMGRKTDDAGHLIAKRLGGTGKNTYNIIPQNLTINRGTWKQIENKVYEHVEKYDKVRFTINPIYSSSRSTRPVYLAYEIKYSKGKGYQLLSKEIIQNP